MYIYVYLYTFIYVYIYTSTDERTGNLETLVPPVNKNMFKDILRYNVYIFELRSKNSNKYSYICINISKYTYI
jgi:hypothetical protein